jgi:hypothetical protein
MNCPYCKEEIPEYSNLDFHVQTEHGFSVPAQYTQDTITRAMKDQDLDKIESFEYTQKQLENAKHWWEKAKLPHETEKWDHMRIGDRQRIIGRYADYMYKKHVTSFERDLKPTGKNHGIDFYMQLAEQDYLNGTTHTPDEYENKLYGLEDTALKRYGVPRDLPNGEEIVDSTYGTELHAKDWWDSKNIKNEKGDGKSRKWEDLDPSERKGIRQIFDDKVKGDYLQESFEQLAVLDSMPVSSIVTMMVQRVLPDLEFLPNKIQQRVKKFVGSNEAVGLSRDWDEEEKGEIETKPTQLGYMWDDIWRDEDTGFYKDTPSAGKDWQKGGEYYTYGSEVWKCPKCDKEFGVAGHSREGERFEHLMSHESSTGDGYWDIRCDTCDFTSDKESQNDKGDDHKQHRKDFPDHEYKFTDYAHSWLFSKEGEVQKVDDSSDSDSTVDTARKIMKGQLDSYNDDPTPKENQYGKPQGFPWQRGGETKLKTGYVQCPHCNTQMSRLDWLQDHIKTSHPTKANEDSLIKIEDDGKKITTLDEWEGEAWGNWTDNEPPMLSHDQIKLMRGLGIADKTLKEMGYDLKKEDEEYATVDEGLLDKIEKTLTVDNLEKQLDKLGLGYTLADRDPKQVEDEYATIIEALKASEYLDLDYPISGFDWNYNDGEPIFTCKHCNKELVDDSMEGMKNHLKEHGITGHIEESKANEGGFGSGKKGHVSWMSDMEYGGNYRVCPNCNVNTLFESKKCTLCGL